MKPSAKAKKPLVKPSRPDHGQSEALRHGVARSKDWPKTERAFRKAHPTCVACRPGASSHAVQVHHRFPFHYAVKLGRPDLELDSRNLISLCEDEKGRPAQDHHLLIGHLDDFKSANLNVLEDAASTFHGLSKEQIKEDSAWQQRRDEGKLKALDEMTEEEKNAFRAKMNETFPLRRS